MELLKEYLALCFFQKNPLYLHPTAQFLLKNLLFFFGIGFLIEANISDITEGALEITINAIIMATLVLLLLLFTKKLYLFMQLFTALIVVENFILFLGFITAVADVIVQQTSYAVVTIIITVDLVLWFVAIVAYILRQMFLFKPVKSAVLAMIYCFFSTFGAFIFTELM